jgi:hypothetical protein
MCYTIFISTTSPEDFEDLPEALYRFEIPNETNDAEPLSMLRYPNRWYLSGRYGGCSCHFRHESASNTSQVGPSQQFAPPEDWCPEDEEYVESTGAVYNIFARLIAEGHSLDVLDIWNGEDVSAVKTLGVSLKQVPRDSFQFFENYRFEVTA